MTQISELIQVMNDGPVYQWCEDRDRHIRKLSIYHFDFCYRRFIEKTFTTCTQCSDGSSRFDQKSEIFDNFLKVVS